MRWIKQAQHPMCGPARTFPGTGQAHSGMQGGAARRERQKGVAWMHRKQQEYPTRTDWECRAWR